MSNASSQVFSPSNHSEEVASTTQKNPSQKNLPVIATTAAVAIPIILTILTAAISLPLGLVLGAKTITLLNFSSQHAKLFKILVSTIPPALVATLTTTISLAIAIFFACKKNKSPQPTQSNSYSSSDSGQVPGDLPDLEDVDPNLEQERDSGSRTVDQDSTGPARKVVLFRKVPTSDRNEEGERIRTVYRRKDPTVTSDATSEEEAASEPQQPSSTDDAIPVDRVVNIEQEREDRRDSSQASTEEESLPTQRFPQLSEDEYPEISEETQTPHTVPLLQPENSSPPSTVPSEEPEQGEENSGRPPQHSRATSSGVQMSDDEIPSALGFISSESLLSDTPTPTAPIPQPALPMPQLPPQPPSSSPSAPSTRREAESSQPPRHPATRASRGRVRGRRGRGRVRRRRAGRGGGVPDTSAIAPDGIPQNIYEQLLPTRREFRAVEQSLITAKQIQEVRYTNKITSSVVVGFFIAGVAKRKITTERAKFIKLTNRAYNSSSMIQHFHPLKTLLASSKIAWLKEIISVVQTYEGIKTSSKAERRREANTQYLSRHKSEYPLYKKILDSFAKGAPTSSGRALSRMLGFAPWTPSLARDVELSIPERTGEYNQEIFQGSIKNMRAAKERGLLSDEYLEAFCTLSNLNVEQELPKLKEFVRNNKFSELSRYIITHRNTRFTPREETTE